MMLKKMVLAGGLVIAGGLGPASAQSTFTAWGHEFTLSSFQPVQKMMAVATDRRTGRKFNVVRTRSGRMMVVVSPSQMRPARNMGGLM